MPNDDDLCVVGIHAITKFSWTTIDKLTEQVEEEIIQLPAVLVHDVTKDDDDHDRLMIGCEDGSISIFYSSDPKQKMTFHATNENGQPRYGRVLYVKLHVVTYSSEFLFTSVNC